MSNPELTAQEVLRQNGLLPEAASFDWNTPTSLNTWLGDASDSPVLLRVDLSEYVDDARPDDVFVIYSRRRRSKVEVKYVGETGKGSYEIPKDYPGWFRLRGSSFQKLNSVDELARVGNVTSTQWLLVSELTATRASDDIVLFPGEVLRPTSVGEKTLTCETAEQLRVKINRNCESKLYQISRKSNNRGIQQMSTLMESLERGSEIDLVFGWPPLQQEKPDLTDRLRFQVLQIYKPDTLVMCQLTGRLRGRIVEIPRDIQIRVQPCRDFEKVQQSTALIRGIQMCRAYVFPYVTNIKQINDRFPELNLAKPVDMSIDFKSSNVVGTSSKDISLGWRIAHERAEAEQKIAIHTMIDGKSETNC